MQELITYWVQFRKEINKDYEPKHKEWLKEYKDFLSLESTSPNLSKAFNLAALLRKQPERPSPSFADFMDWLVKENIKKDAMISTHTKDLI